MSVFLIRNFSQKIGVATADFVPATGKISGFSLISILYQISCKINANLARNFQFTDLFNSTRVLLCIAASPGLYS